MTYEFTSAMDRRRFLKVGVAAGAGVLAIAAVPKLVEGILDGSPDFTPAADLSADLLLPLQGDAVQVVGVASEPDTLLVRAVPEVTSYSAGGGSATIGESFSVIFEGPADRSLAQDTYEMNHRRLGRFPVFITPVDQLNGVTQRYEAVFNRLR